MSYHRGGHPGAVAVSYSTSTMAPLSPSRRYPGSTGSGTSGTSGTNSGSASKYSTYRSSTSSASSNLGSERNGGYYQSSSNTGYRGGSYTNSANSDTFRRSFFSPARSVSSYNETSSIVGSSSLSGNGLRYGSASSSSASSTASSTSSCNSRDRNALQQHHTPGSLATTAADLYAIYSPTNYVPNIHGTSTLNSTKSNNHWRPSSSSSSSGVSSGGLAELHGGDEYDTFRERRERSYSSETSSGVGLTSNNITTSNNHVSPVDRWTTRREAKRRGTPTGISTGNTSRDKLDSVATTIEVTTETRDTTKTSIVHDKSPDNTKKSQIITSNIVTLSDTSSETRKNGTLPISNNELNDNNVSLVLTQNHDVTNVTRDIDDNNETRNNDKSLLNNSNSNDRDTLTGRENAKLTTNRRRRRVSDDSNVLTNRETDIHCDENDDVTATTTTTTTTTTATTTRYANNLVLVRQNCDDRDDNNTREIKVSFNGENSTSGNNRGNEHHYQPQQHDLTSLNDETLSNVVNVVPTPNTDNLTNDNAFNTVTSSSSESSLSSTSPISENSSSILSNSILTTFGTGLNHKNESPNSQVDLRETLISIKTRDNEKVGNLSNSNVKKDRGVEIIGGGDCAGAGGDADHHRTAYTWTKLPTNIDNTELLTNNNAQDREILGIVETTRNELARTTNTSSGTRINERTGGIVKGARKTLIWTATNENETDFIKINDDTSLSDNVGKDENFGNSIDTLTNGDKRNLELTNGCENFSSSGNIGNSRIYDFNRDEMNGMSTLLINGVKPTGNRSDEPDKASTSRRTNFGWNDPIDDLNGPSSSSTINTTGSSGSTAGSSSATNSIPVAVHQNLYRGINEQIDESSNSRPPRNRLQSRRDERYGLNGLRNIGNTCFMNSVIQCLSNTRPLLEYLLNEQHLHDINTTTSSMKGALIKAFGQVIHELWEMSGDHVVNTTALKSQIQRFAPRFMGYSQQDAQEFLRYLLEGLHEDVNRVTVKPQPILTDIPDHYSDSHKAAESWKRYLRSEDSTIVDVFVGQLRSSLHCTSCDHVSVTLDPVWDLSLPIPSRSGTVKLNQCLEHFTKVETLDGDEKPTCSKCQMRRKCTKSFSIQKFPKILVIHLKRFSPTERFRGKLSVLVDFPLMGLDLSAFAAPGVQGCTYNLYGVANHSGTTYSGHYTAYCKHPYSGEWHEYNDSRVSSVPARSVVSSEAYVLFYEQQPPSPHL